MLRSASRRPPSSRMARSSRSASNSCTSRSAPTRLPVWEMVFGSMPDSQAAIATRKVKWDKKYQTKYGITTRAADELPAPVVAQLDKLSRRIYRALSLSGCARMDFRVTGEGQVYVLEANANPNLEAEEDFAESARAAGIAYDDLL